MISKNFISKMEEKYPGLERVGEPLTEQQEKSVDVAGVQNHGIDLDTAFLNHFKPGSKRVKGMVQAAIKKP
jgi:hypothetical protein